MRTGRSARLAINSQTLQRGRDCLVKQGNPPPNNGTLQPKSGFYSGTSGHQSGDDHSLPRPVYLKVSATQSFWPYGPGNAWSRLLSNWRKGLKTRSRSTLDPAEACLAKLELHDLTPCEVVFGRFLSLLFAKPLLQFIKRLRHRLVSRNGYFHCGKPCAGTMFAANWPNISLGIERGLSNIDWVCIRSPVTQNEGSPRTL